MPPLRTLLPAARGSPGVSRERPPIDLPPKRRSVSLACETCRQHKTKCDGIRPICRGCIRRGKECRYRPEPHQIKEHYQWLQQGESASDELIELIRVMAEKDAVEVLRRLRAGTDAASIVKSVKEGHLLMQLSLVPDAYRRYEFPYVFEMPSHLTIPDNPYLESLLYRAASSQSMTHNGALYIADEARELNHSDVIPQDLNAPGNSTLHMTSPTRHPLPYLIPYHAARMVEPTIEKITAAPWTQVISDNRLLRRLISHYFVYPHPCGPFVHKDLFLQDMAAGQTRFCSPLLVNAMLSIACQSCLEIPNRSKVWLQDSLTYRFMAEARRLWDVDSFRESSIPTIQAALILSYTTTNNGMDQNGAMYLRRACEMGQDLNIFESDNHGQDEKLAKASTYTAWLVFSWQAMFNYSFFRPPSLEKPPNVPLPDAKIEPQWYGEIWMQYPHDETVHPLYLGHKIQLEAALHTIMNEMGLILYQKSSKRSFTLDDIIMIEHNLDDWKKSLPEPLQPEKLVFPLHMMLHVQYQQLVMAFMQVLISSNYNDDTTIRNLFGGKSLASVLDEAQIMLETVMRLYYIRHDFELYDPWISFALTVIGNMAITNLARQSSSSSHTLAGYRSTLILSAQGLNKQGLNYHVGTLLAIQLQKAMDPGDSQLVQTHISVVRIDEDDQLVIAEHSHSMWPIPGVTVINEDPEKTRLKNVIRAFKDVQIDPNVVEDM